MGSTRASGRELEELGIYWGENWEDGNTDLRVFFVGGGG